MHRIAPSALALPLLVGACSSSTPAGRDACDYIADACHDATSAAAEACHDLGHDGDVAACEDMLASCLVACTYDAGAPPDAGTPDAGPADTGPGDAPVEDAGPADVVIRFDGRVGTEDFACGTTYSLGTPARDAEPVDFRFYVHDVRLLTADGTEVPVALATSDFQAMGVALIDFEDGSDACIYGDAETNAEIHGTVPSGDYTGIAFRLGIPFEMNHVELTSLPTPLNRTSLFWSWRGGHLFMSAMTRTAVMANPDAGVGDFVEHATHVGSTMCMGNPEMGMPVTSCARPNRPEIRLIGFDPTTTAIVADFAEIKADDDVAGESCHSFTPNCAFSFDALGLNWATGSMTPTTQTVFSAE